MNKIKDGGPAFPESYIGADTPHEGIGGGMSLRDYFAAKCITAMVNTIRTDADYMRYRVLAKECDMESVGEWFAHEAYKQADAMLTAREVHHP